MDSEIKAEWIKALRSGDFRQGVQALKRSENGKFNYCCLGVLQEINGRMKDRPITTLAVSRIFSSITHSCTSLTLEDNRYYDIPSHDISMVITMNDGGHSFADIADYIEANL
jgi:hypothetical protein